jgi:hypothetical protein
MIATVTRRTFTPEEANAALADVRPLAERMVRQRRRLARVLERRSALRQRIGSNGGGLDFGEPDRLRAAAERASAEVARCVERIHELGAEVKDLDRGLLDFPALRRGERVLLCWHVGEDEIAFWHGEHDGFAGRRPLPL